MQRNNTMVGNVLGICSHVDKGKDKDKGHHIGLFVVIKMDNKSVEATPACAPGHSRWHLVKDFHIIRFLKWFSKC